MTPIVANQIERLLPKSSAPHLIVGEVPAAQGIADIVAVRFNRQAMIHRLDGGVGPILSPHRIRILSLLRQDRGMRVSTLARKIGSNPDALSRSTLVPLAEQGLVDFPKGLVQATGAWRPAGAQITSIELKLSKWRGALHQADNFAMSADRSWVVLDESRSKTAISSAELFREFGVGLAVLSKDGRLKVHVRPAGRRPEMWLHHLIAEHAWSIAEAEVADLSFGA